MLDHFIIFAFGNAEPQLYENSAQIQVRPLPDAMTESLVNYIVQNGQIAHVIYGASLFDALTAHAGKLERMEGTILILAIKHQFSVDKHQTVKSTNWINALPICKPSMKGVSHCRLPKIKSVTHQTKKNIMSNESYLIFHEAAELSWSQYDSYHAVVRKEFDQRILKHAASALLSRPFKSVTVVRGPTLLEALQHYETQLRASFCPIAVQQSDVIKCAKVVEMLSKLGLTIFVEDV